MPLFGIKKKDKDKEKHHGHHRAKPPVPGGHHGAGPGFDKKQKRLSMSVFEDQPEFTEQKQYMRNPASTSMQNLAAPARTPSGKDMSKKIQFFEERKPELGSLSPEKKRVTEPRFKSSGDLSFAVGEPDVKPSVTVSAENVGQDSPQRLSRTGSNFSEASASSRSSSSRHKRDSMLSLVADDSPTEIGKEKTFEGADLELPPLQTATVKLRTVVAVKNPMGGGFGFILRKSYQPDPEEPERTCLVHLVEPRTDYSGPLMTGDRIMQVSGEEVEDCSHEEVVDMIKASGDAVELLVASVPELMELNSRGALDEDTDALQRAVVASSSRIMPGTGTLRRHAAHLRRSFKAKSVEEVLSEKDSLSKERVWVVHRGGFSLGTIVHDSPRRTNLLTHVSLVRYQGRETYRVRLEHSPSKEVIEVDEEDLERVNPVVQDKVEDLTELTNLNESCVLHVLRQRYASSLIHTFAGEHLVVVNPLRPLSSYTDRVIIMFRGCRREDMPPHIFAVGQQAYRSMMTTREDQSLVLMGLSGSGKTFNARYLLRYLSTISQNEYGPVSSAKLDAVELLLHSFGSASTYLNPQASRCTCLYSLEFDPSGLMCGTSVKTFFLEKNRVAYRPKGEGSFNILYQMLAGADEQLKAELLLNAPGEDNLYIEPHDDPQRVESDAYVWDLIQKCLEVLEISQEEARGIWSLLAAIYHLGFAGVKKSMNHSRFLDPAAAQRAAMVLGINHEELGRNIFSPPRGMSLRLSSLFSNISSSPTPLDGPLPPSPSPSASPKLPSSEPEHLETVSLDSFVMGLYDQAFNALIMLINKSLFHTDKGRSSIHVLDAPGFQNREMAGCRNGASFDDLCMNYAQERFQMLLHDSTFTSEQNRYLQENINWTFSELPISPLPVIDMIDKHVPQRRGAVDFHTDKRGILWMLEEESVFPGASDGTFLDRVQMYHGETDEKGGPLVKVMKEDNQFVIFHCQRTLPVLYNVTNWVRRAREHASFRVVVQVLAESKRPSIASVFQGRGVAASATSISASALKANTSSSSLSQAYSSPSSSSTKKSSICLQTKFQLDILMDTLRKTKQWYIRCILPQLPSKLPGALPSPSPAQPTPTLPTGHIDVPLVRAQLRRAELVKAARMYKQGFPEHLAFPEFRRRYGALVPTLDLSVSDKDAVKVILDCQEVDRNSYRIGLSQIFLRTSTLSSLDQHVEETTHDTMVLFQARCRGWLGRKRREQLEIQHSAALIIQDNIDAAMVINEWSWWKLYMKVKPLLAVWRAEEEIKKKDKEIETLKTKVVRFETEQDVLKRSERVLQEKVTQLSAELEEVQLSSSETSELLESLQYEKLKLQEELGSITGTEVGLKKKNEELTLQIAEMSILARIKQTEDSEVGPEGSSDAVLEKYHATRRELESLKQHLSSEHEDEIERLQTAKKSLEKRLADSEGETEDLRKTLSQVRKKASKLGSELNDLKLHLESQQARNAELEKRQRKFDSELNTVKEEAQSERSEKEKAMREKSALQSEFTELQQSLKLAEEERKKMRQEKEDLESEMAFSTSSSAEGELSVLKQAKRELEGKVVELEDELDELKFRSESFQQVKARLELANKTLRQQQQKELESREEELEAVKSTMNKKIKSLTNQVDELLEEGKAAAKSRRDMEHELLVYQSKMGDAENERKLKKKVHKLNIILQDMKEELELEREKSSKSAALKTLRAQLEESQESELSASKAQKRLQGELEDLQTQYDDLTRNKMELDSRVSELGREKAELEIRAEEAQDECEDLLGSQRSHMAQISSLQSQLNEANMQVDDLQDSKQSLEKKLQELRYKVTDLESGVNRHQYEASEQKVRDLEQKLEAEKSSSKRSEHQVNRLRHQLERLQEEKSEGEASHRSDEALKRLQKQIRDLRSSLQDAEKREHDLVKKRRATEGKLEETEASLSSTQAELKSAQKRIQSLHKALQGHEEESNASSEEESYLPPSPGDGLSSSDSGGSVARSRFNKGSQEFLSVGDGGHGHRSGSTGRELGEEDPKHSRLKGSSLKRDDDYKPKSKYLSSDDEDEELFKRYGGGKGGEGGRKRLGDEDFGIQRSRRRYSEDSEDSLTKKYSSSSRNRFRNSEEDAESKPKPSRNYKSMLSDDDDDFDKRYKLKGNDDDYGKRYKRKDDDDDDFDKRYKLKDDDDKLASKKKAGAHRTLSSEDDDDIEDILKRASLRREGLSKRRDLLSDKDDEHPSTTHRKESSSTQRRADLSFLNDDDDDDIDDILSRHKSRRKYEDDSDEEDDLSHRKTTGKQNAERQTTFSPEHKADGEHNDGTGQQDEGGVDSKESDNIHSAAMRRRRHRRRTIEAESKMTISSDQQSNGHA